MNFFFRILFFVLWLIPFQVFGQVELDSKSKPSGTDPQKPKEKIVISRVLAWELDKTGAFIDSVTVDTLYKNFHIYNPIYKESITNTYTGNYGGAYVSNDFSTRKFNTDFYLFRTHDAYLLTPDKINYYNTTTPYSMLDYSQSENKSRKNETRFNVLHSQNVTPNLNFTFRYDQAKSVGQYNYQAGKNNFITLYSSYTSDRLNVHGGFIFNRINHQENGGMVNDDVLQSTSTEFIEMKLTDASSSLKNSYVFATVEYKLGITSKDTSEKVKPLFKPIAGLIYSIVFSNNLRLFSEGKENDNSSFFSDYYLNSVFTHDSVRFKNLANLVQLKFYESAQKKYSFGKRIYVGIENTRRTFSAPGYEKPVFPFFPGEYIGHLYAGPPARWNNSSYANLFVGGGIFRQAGKFWTWNFEGKQFITGYKAGQTELAGKISKPFLFLMDSLAVMEIESEILNRVPDYFQQEYFSNRVKWKNSFVNEQVMNASFRFISPVRNLEAGARYSIINNYIYNNQQGLPAQTKGQILILSAFVNKNFNLGSFNIQSQLVWQKPASDQFIHLPDIMARLAVDYNLLVARVLYMQVGVDTRYTTAYYADAYQPATGLFYLQNEKKLGGYPSIDAFANLKLKRTRLFFQYMNLGSSFLNNSYFSALHYPMNKRTFRFGVAWSFYN